uniref:Mitochondrial calcium uniporter regulator 1 n=1 Tax=Phasianus colchicus TaxID=9054 RepID=A0A669PDZ4_PHACC
PAPEAETGRRQRRKGGAQPPVAPLVFLSSLAAGSGRHGREAGAVSAAAPRRPPARFRLTSPGMLLPFGGVLPGRGGSGRCFGAAAALLSVFVLVEVSSLLAWGFQGGQCALSRAVAVMLRVPALLRPVGNVWRARVFISCYFVRIRQPSACLSSGVSSSAPSFLQSKDSVSLLGNRKLFFDTHALVCLLEGNGFTTQQSEVIVSAFVKIVNTNLDMIYKDMVTKVQQEIALQQIMSHIGGLKKDMIILEKSEFSALRSENEDEITKVRADNKLNLNLEKSRVKELYSLNERKLLEMRTEIVELHAQQDRALTQTDRKIDTEVADLKTMLESHKLDNIKYLAGSVFTCLTVALGFYRLWM